MLKLLWGRIWPYVAGVAGIIAGLIYVRQSGKAAARTEQDAKINQSQAKAGKEARDVQNTVAKMGDDPIADKLKSDWVRSDKGGD